LNVNGVGGWFLPSRDELALLYRNLKATGAADFGDGGRHDNVSYWASSQLTADMAAHIDFADLGRQHFRRQGLPSARPGDPRILMKHLAAASSLHRLVAAAARGPLDRCRAAARAVRHHAGRHRDRDLHAEELARDGSPDDS
jgi:hypothetical protein